MVLLDGNDELICRAPLNAKKFAHIQHVAVVGRQTLEEFFKEGVGSWVKIEAETPEHIAAPYDPLKRMTIEEEAAMKAGHKEMERTGHPHALVLAMLKHLRTSIDLRMLQLAECGRLLEKVPCGDAVKDGVVEMLAHLRRHETVREDLLEPARGDVTVTVPGKRKARAEGKGKVEA